MRRLSLTLTLAALAAAPAFAEWSQFGGPRRDFSLDKPPRIAPWGETGPRQLWRRELGPGYSALVADAQVRRLFTQTRDGAEEVVLALDADSGETLWEHRYSAPVEGLFGVDMSYGNAPQATPLLVEGRLIGLGFTGVLWAVDAEDGAPLWSTSLGKEHQAAMPYFGHAASPLWVPAADGEGGFVVVLAGGALAFDPATGELRWQNRDFGASYASPVVADTAFGRQILVAGAGDVVGLDPQDGQLLWRHEYRNPQRTILGTPLLVEDDLLFVSAYFLGSRGLRLLARDRVEQVWEQPDFQVSHFNTVRDGHIIYTTFRRNLIALDATSGEILWRERRFGAANLLRSGQRGLLLGEHGELTTAELDGQGLTRRQSARLLKDRSWTPPTVIGDRLYVRDQHLAVAYDLSSAEAPVTASAAPENGAPELPEDFAKAVAELESAARRGDLGALEKAAGGFSPWAEHEQLATWAAYYEGYGYWILSQASAKDRRLDFLDRAVEAQKRAVELDRENVDAHAVLGSLYSLYYRLAPRRAMVVGPLGGEHMGLALSLDPENPRAQAIQALSLAYRPPQWGGDPAAGRQKLREVIEKTPLEANARVLLGEPAWLPATCRVWLARLLISDGGAQQAEARRLLDEVLAVSPDHAQAASMRAGLPPRPAS
ncbi:MAG: PQQ-binding-like beta-propeller repeat protein [Acidobacteriota bacterium]